MANWRAGRFIIFSRRRIRRRYHEWHLSPEQSLLLHAENTVIPTHVVVYTPRGTNNAISLLFGTSIYDLRQAEMPPAQDLALRDGLRLFSPAAALVKVPQAFFLRNPIETQLVLASIADGSDVLRLLLNGGHSKKAGQHAAALRRIGRPEIADEIVKTMKGASYDVRESDPFAPEETFGMLRPATAPIVGRLQAMWESMRSQVIDIFPKASSLPRNKDAYLHFADQAYTTRITRCRSKAIPSRRP